jgi:tRNA(Ile)-lysidine synthetase-like protein
MTTDFYFDWMKHEYYWFNQFEGFDNYLSINYGHLIDDFDYQKSNEPIIAILIYDQLTRHYYRKEQAYHIIAYFNQKALEIALEYKRNDFIKNLHYNDWLFYMLVFRHTNQKEHLFFAMEEGWKRGSRSFLKATYNRAKFEEELDYYHNHETTFNKSILEYWHDSPNEKFKNHLGNYSQLSNKKIIVSLSGGVDSITCLYNSIHIYGNTKVVTVHINYNNRPETQDEVNFLIWICKKLKVDLYVRTITEIKRQKAMDNDMREVYENYTKRVRFNSYRKVNEVINGDSKAIPIVILGHNKDDCLENILTNIAYKNKYDNLNGIELSMMIDNIHFYRPLIDVYKKDIYDYAKNNQLSFLKNSTPDWCQRGKIRTSVIPALEKWDSRVFEGLLNVTSILKDLHLNLYMNINNNFKNKDTFDVNNLNTSFLYWKYGIFKLFNFYPSNKSLNSLISRLESWKNTYKSREINKKTKIIIKKDLYLSLWKSKIANQMTYEFTNAELLL